MSLNENSIVSRVGTKRALGLVAKCNTVLVEHAIFGTIEVKKGPIVDQLRAQKAAENPSEKTGNAGDEAAAEKFWATEMGMRVDDDGIPETYLLLLDSMPEGDDGDETEIV